MARSLKSRGVEDLKNVRQRAERQHALGRIGVHDRDEIVSRINKLIKHIVEMEEIDENEEVPF